MEDHKDSLEFDRLSVISAAILLVYAVTPFIGGTYQGVVFQILNVEFSLEFDNASLLSILVMVMAGIGADWFLHDHPKFSRKDSLQHWILPALTAWAIGIPLRSLEMGIQWWGVLGFGGLLLILVLIGEYLVVDVTDARNTLATMGLTAVSFGLYLLLAISVRNGELRLYLVLPVLVSAMAAVCLRTLYLRLGGRWCYSWSFTIAVIIGQIVIGLHYWPLDPISYGLFILGTAYGLTSLVGAIEEKQPRATLWIEPSIMVGIIWIIALVTNR